MNFKTKLKCLILFGILLSAGPAFAKEGLISFSVGISSGIPLYGPNSVLSTGTEIEKGNRVILGSVASINLNVIKQATFFLGNDMLWDLTWNSVEKSNKLHTSFPLGIKIYPGIGGLNAGLAYTLGFRADFINTNATGEYNGISPWGNGFKFLIEYNFAHDGNSKYLPTIGGYWNLMPRGNDSYDNILVLYLAANF